MASAEPESFPFEAVRDLLGILRALYAAHKARGASPVRLGQIQKLALTLRRATALAAASDPDTAKRRLAFEMAEKATLGLADLVDVTTPLEPTLLVAGERVRAHRARSSVREAARRARLIRS
jgi:hypothetical protein